MNLAADGGVYGIKYTGRNGEVYFDNLPLGTYYIEEITPPYGLDAVYAATKAYILFFSKAIRAELKGTGVTATTLCPGSTQTNFADKVGIQGTLLFKLFVMKPEKVACAGYKSMMKGKSKYIPGIYNNLLGTVQ